MIKTHFVFAVSFVAMLAVSSALADAPSTAESVGTAHTVYEAQTPADEDRGAGIAGVSYVNRVVNMAGASAQAAEAHAAAAGQAALVAAASAAAANDAIAGADNTPTEGSDKMITSGGVYAALGGLSDGVSDLTGTVQSLQDSVGDLETALDGKQATIGDLATIRSGAAAGATALQKADIATGTSNGTISVDGTDVAVKGLGSAAYTASTAYATAAQGALAASAVQPEDLADVATSGSYNNLTDKPTIPSGALASKNTITNADVADNAAIAQSKISGLTTALSGKQATIGDLATIRSGAAAGATAVQPGDLGALATKSTITTSDITNGTIKDEDIAANAAIAISKISGLQTALDGKLSTGGTAAKATADASGNEITTTYATKGELGALSTTAGNMSTTVDGLVTQVGDLESDKQNKLTATGSANRPVYATAGGVAAVTGISIPIGSATATSSTQWASIWVE